MITRTNQSTHTQPTESPKHITTKKPDSSRLGPRYSDQTRAEGILVPDGDFWSMSIHASPLRRPWRVHDVGDDAAHLDEERLHLPSRVPVKDGSSPEIKLYNGRIITKSLSRSLFSIIVTWIFISYTHRHQHPYACITITQSVWITINLSFFISNN